MHIGRKGNMAAHCLAKYGLDLQEEKIWVEECLEFVMEFIIKDVPVLVWMNANISLKK